MKQQSTLFTKPLRHTLHQDTPIHNENLTQREGSPMFFWNGDEKTSPQKYLLPGQKLLAFRQRIQTMEWKSISRIFPICKNFF